MLGDSELRDILQNTWRLLFKGVNDKESQIVRDERAMTNKCNMVYWLGHKKIKFNFD